MFKSNISPLIAEQIHRKSLVVTTTKNGERVIIDPIMTVSRIYMVWAVCSSIQVHLLLWTVFLPVHQYRCIGRPDRNDLLRESMSFPYLLHMSAHPCPRSMWGSG